jgi:uncharacterized membrane protein YtjA (UPF0391 family)
MLTWAIAFLLIAIVAGSVGMLAVGPAAPILFIIFFGLFIWSLAQYLRGRRRGPDGKRR